MHVNDPWVSVHVDSPEGQLCTLRVHSFTLLHVTPLPVQPTLQAQVKDPDVSEHVD